MLEIRVTASPTGLPAWVPCSQHAVFASSIALASEETVCTLAQVSRNHLERRPATGTADALNGALLTRVQMPVRFRITAPGHGGHHEIFAQTARRIPEATVRATNGATGRENVVRLRPARQPGFGALG